MVVCSNGLGLSKWVNPNGLQVTWQFAQWIGFKQVD